MGIRTRNADEKEGGCLKDWMSSSAKYAPRRAPVTLIIGLLLLADRKSWKQSSSWLVRGGRPVCDVRLHAERRCGIFSLLQGAKLTLADISRV